MEDEKDQDWKCDEFHGETYLDQMPFVPGPRLMELKATKCNQNFETSVPIFHTIAINAILCLIYNICFQTSLTNFQTANY